MTKILIQNGRVHEIFGDTVPPLAPELEAQIVDAPANVREGWLFDGAVFTPPPSPAPPPPPPARHTALDAAIQGASNLEALKAVLRGKVAAR